MPYSLKVEGMAEISEALEKLEQDAPAVAAKAVYIGAGIVQKAVLDEMNKIKTAPFSYAKDGQQRLPSPEEKEILVQAGVGVAKFDKNGLEIDTSVGFNQSGYANVSWNHMNGRARTNYKLKSFKGHASNSTSFLKAVGQYVKGMQNQKPIGVIANAINSGTSFMQKQPFVRKGANKGAPKAIEAMKEFIENELNAINK